MSDALLRGCKHGDDPTTCPRCWSVIDASVKTVYTIETSPRWWPLVNQDDPGWPEGDERQIVLHVTDSGPEIKQFYLNSEDTQTMYRQVKNYVEKLHNTGDLYGVSPEQLDDFTRWVEDMRGLGD